MSRERGTLLRSEVLHHVIGEANAAIEQLAVARGAVVRDSRLQQMAHAVELVGAIHFGEAFGRALFAPVSVSCSRLARIESRGRFPCALSFPAPPGSLGPISAIDCWRKGTRCWGSTIS